jgi:hypothetical protein
MCRNAVHEGARRCQTEGIKNSDWVPSCWQGWMEADCDTAQVGPADSFKCK